MRNKYSDEFNEYVLKKSKTMKKENLRKHLEKKFNLEISKTSFEKYLYKHNVKCVDYNEMKANNNSYKCPIGTEYIKDDGMTLVKVAQPSVWKYKQRLIYEQYYNCKLTDDDYIIFLNQDRNDFRIENLKKISRHESSILSNQDMFSSNSKLTELGILTAQLMIKAKEKTN